MSQKIYSVSWPKLFCHFAETLRQIVSALNIDAEENPVLRVSSLMLYGHTNETMENKDGFLVEDYLYQ